MTRVEFILQGQIGEAKLTIAYRDLQQVPAQWQHVVLDVDGPTYQIIGVTWQLAIVDGPVRASVYVQRLEQYDKTKRADSPAQGNG